jgi:hypothetical protein
MKYAVCTSQETHYFSATYSSRLMLYKIADFHGCDYEEFHMWDVMPCGSCKSRRFGGTYCRNPHGDKNRGARNNIRI